MEKFKSGVRCAAVKLMMCLLIYGGFNFTSADTEALQIQFSGSTNAVFFAEIASDGESRAKGLMHRTHLPECSGMWFDFGSPRVVSMWMRDTLVPLDIIFVGRDLRVRAIFQNAAPLSDSLIKSPQATQYVLEINAGKAVKNNLAVGQQVTIGPRKNLASLTSRLKCS
jgi:uncharacterized membrane protein (UPF0127 family)